MGVSKIRTDVPGYGGKKRLGGIKGCKVFKEKYLLVPNTR